MRFASVYPWDAVLKFHGAYLHDIEYGRRSWTSDRSDLKELYLYPRASEMKQSRSTRGKSTDDIQFCWSWQDSKCNDKNCKYKHICSACYKYRKTVADHPKCKCPYNDEAYRDAEKNSSPHDKKNKVHNRVSGQTKVQTSEQLYISKYRNSNM